MFPVLLSSGEAIGRVHLTDFSHCLSMYSTSTPKPGGPWCMGWTPHLVWVYDICVEEDGLRHPGGENHGVWDGLLTLSRYMETV
jgi:hypothetical protein